MALHGGCTLLYPGLATSGASIVAALRIDITALQRRQHDVMIVTREDDDET